MKTIILKRLLLLTLATSLGCSHAAAQVFSPLHEFNGERNDADTPFAGLVLSGNTLYGTTIGGGSQGGGTVFSIHTDGTGYTNLCSFDGFDGLSPFAGLVLSSNILYGTTESGGMYYYLGTVFAVNTDGTDFTNLCVFNGGSNGAKPYAGLLLSGNTLYGTTESGGSSNVGTVFAVNTDGASFTNLHNFTGGDGANPYAGLVLSGNTLYGTTYYGGSSSNGTLFAIHTNGTGYTNLYSFTALNSGTNSDGANPYAGLMLSGNTLYGTAEQGGSFGNGTIFRINTDGTGFTNVYNFTGGDDGANPDAGLLLSGNTLYGTAVNGGEDGVGTVFAVNINGTNFTTLTDFFPDGYDGISPEAGLLLSGNTLYGTTFGWSSGEGSSVFALSLGSIPLNIQSSGQNLVLTWGNPAFSLQSEPSLTGQWTTVSNAASPYTISATNAQAFFRLFYTNSP